MNYTKGPWKYYPGDYPVGPAIVPGEGPVITSFFNEAPDLRSDEEHDANGYAIAATPELVQMCKDVLVFFEGRWAEVGNHPASRYATWVNDIQSLLAKAER